MQLPSSVVPLSTSVCPIDDPILPPPAWVADLLDRSARWSTHPVPAGAGFSIDVTPGDHFCLASLRIRDARGLGRADLHDATARAYRCLEAELRLRGTRHPVRLWNHIPGIHDPMGGGQDRYMAFNAGRYEALSEWFGGQESFDTRVASASGIGHEGRDLVIHCLASDRPGQAVDNPRQVVPWRYSQKYGPLPPCFARATVIHPPSGSPLVLVGGTASIVGEESVHLGHLERQTGETLTNLAVLVHAAAGKSGAEGVGRAAALACYRELRVYYPDPERLEELQGLLADVFPAGTIEWVRADLCRAELLVEIEGVAELGAR
jgi:chorismate lyase/3-hydroxybenzoate synthase